MIETLRMDHVRTARAKGAGEGRVVLVHALRNAMIPVVTVMALSFGGLFSGALITETMFAQPGMGKMIYDAILGNDFNLALTGLLFATLVTLLSNLLADLAYGWLDPRIVAMSVAHDRPCRRSGRLSAGGCAGGDFDSTAPAWAAWSCWPCCWCSSPPRTRWRTFWASTPMRRTCCRNTTRPRAEHPLGTDDAGRDELVRLMLGGQISLLVGVLSTLAGSVIGLTVGVFSGYFGKRAGRPADALHRRR